MNSSDDYYIDALNHATIYIHRYVVPVFYIMGVVGNLISIWIFSKKPWKKNVCVFYFKVYLLLSFCFNNASTLSTVFVYGNNISAQNSSVLLCKIYFYAAYLFATLTPTVLILASIDRLLISSQNVDTRLYSSKRLAYFSTGLSTVFWTIYNVHILIKVDLQEFYPSVFICYYHLSKAYLNFISYGQLTINVSFCLLMFILSVFAFKNVRHIRIVPRRQRNEIRTMTKKDLQLLRCLLAHDLVFVAFIVWYNVFNVYSAATTDRVQTPLKHAIKTFLSDFVAFLYNISYCGSFFIFLGLSRAFRQELKRSIFKIFGKQLMTMPDDDNRQKTVELNVVTVNTVMK